MARILAIRFSALGDVAMTIPVLYSFAKAYPQHEIVVLSRKGMAPLFATAPSNLRFHGVDLKGYKGLNGLASLYRELHVGHFDTVADLHDVLRTKYLRLRFRLNGVRVAAIDKGRADKRRLTAWKHKVLKQLPTSFERYHEVFRRLGYSFPLQFRSLFGEGKGDLSTLRSLIGEKGTDRWIGIAPFAAHDAKMYPLERQAHIVEALTEESRCHLFLFGGGTREKEAMEQWERRYPHTTSLIGKLRMNEELALMSHLDVMVSMDSANMHLASLVGTPVVSVWGPTHPYAGFMGWNQSMENVMQVDLPCRPCSIYGNKPCREGSHACMENQSVDDIVRKIKEVAHL